MNLLEDDIESLQELDSLRIRSSKLRDQGKASLEAYATALTHNLGEQTWTKANDSIEQALLCRVLSDSSFTSLHQELRTSLERVTIENVFSDEPDRLPILRAARIMQALVAAPDSAFSESVAFCYYRIIRELYLPERPDWAIGGARVGENGPTSAFATSECVRAILALARSLERTAVFIDGFRRLRQKTEMIERFGMGFLKPWQATELRRLKLDLFITIKRYSANIALRLDPPASELTLAYIDEFTDEIEDNLDFAFRTAQKELADAISKIKSFREKEKNEKGRSRRTEIGHTEGLYAIIRALKQAQRALNILHNKEDLGVRLAMITRILSEGAIEIRNLLQPTKRFLENVVDREISAASTPAKLPWDPNELAFATASLGVLSNQWDHDRIVRSADYLSTALTDRGRLPTGRAFLSTEKGYTLHPVEPETLRSVAQIFQFVPSIEMTVSCARSFLAFFEDTLVPRPTAQNMSGWVLAERPEEDRPFLWVTALSVLALDRINRMLDDKINDLVFRHFSVQHADTRHALFPDERDLSLDKLFFTDYGLKLAPEPIRKADSLAVVLERLRAHVVGVEPPQPEWSQLHSLILHGPAGTGKTTLVEALAGSCGVPLIEVTPSDIAIGGAEAIERRARAVFRALSLVTHCVILFDEFEPVLWRRNTEEKRSLFTFLTPGMLPKLKNLNKQAKRRRVAYVLITNLIGQLDEAAIRDGRFDCRRGVYPPDPLSRAGQLVSEILEHLVEVGKNPPDITLNLSRILDVVKMTAGGAMQTLGSSGWFIRPSQRLKKTSPFGYVLGVADTPPSAPRREKLPESARGEGEEAQREFAEWRWIADWDSACETLKDLDDIVGVAPRAIRHEPNPK